MLQQVFFTGRFRAATTPPPANTALPLAPPNLADAFKPVAPPAPKKDEVRRALVPRTGGLDGFWSLPIGRAFNVNGWLGCEACAKKKEGGRPATFAELAARDDLKSINDWGCCPGCHRRIQVLEAA